MDRREKIVQSLALLEEALKPSNQKELFLTIWKQRPHRSAVSGDHLGQEPLAWMFSHILPKGMWPEGKLDPDNVVLMTLEEHQQWENGKSKVRGNHRWVEIFELEARLREKYEKMRIDSRPKKI